MKLVRGIERRLEQLVEGMAGRVFRGSLHPVEMAARVVREADLATTVGEYGPVAPNAYALRLNPKDVTELSQADLLNRELEMAVETTADERGWRLEGPAQVWIETSDQVGPGRMTVEAATDPGERTAWAHLRSGSDRIPVRTNRATVGRGEGADVTVPVASVSRRHCLIWKEAGSVWAADLDSANGTFVNGISAAAEPLALETGDALVLGDSRFTFELG